MRIAAILVGILTIGIFAAVAPPGTPSEAQPNCYPTGFCITNQRFLQYYRERGEHNTLGYPASRSFVLEGFEVQIFQRVALQLQGTNVERLNILDPGIMPLTRANQSIFPGPDPSLAAQAPQVGSPTYANDVVNFVRAVSPDTWNGLPVNFFTTFNRAVPPPPGASPEIITLLNLEIWGVPTSQPAYDPGNQGFVYQRFQRGIMHYQNDKRVTEGILIGDYFKAVISGQNLPVDLDADMRNSRYYRQYNPAAPNWVARPNELPNTNLTGAFETGTGTPVGPPAPPTPPPPPPGTTATVTVTVTPTVVGAGAPTITSFRVDDDRIDGGDSVEVTIIARDDDGVEWIQFEGVLQDSDDNDNGNGNGNDNADDPALARQEFDCDDQVECAKIFKITPNTQGDYELRARAEDTKDNRSEWSTIELEVRSTTSTATPTATTAPAATPTNTPGPAPKP
jgi:hypothetical protein